MRPETAIWLTFGGYLVLLLGLGVLGNRLFGRSYEGFILAGRRLGAWVTAISSAASAESGWLLLGLTGLGFAKGFGAYWIALGGILGYWFNALYVILPLRRRTAAAGARTLSAFIAPGRGLGARLLRMVTALIAIASMTAYVQAQFVSSGKQVQGMGLAGYQEGVWIGALVIALYVVLGGYAAVAFTDLIQGLLMVTVLVVFPLWGMFLLGGPVALVERAAALGLTRLWGTATPVLDAAAGLALGYLVSEGLGIAFGYFGMPHVVIRYFTVRGEREGARAGLIAVLWAVCAYFGAVTLGLVGRVLVEEARLPAPADQEKILPLFAATFLPPLVAGVVLAAVTAAIMSTADSQLMYASTTLVEDLLPEGWLERFPEATRVWIMRAAIAGMSGIALALALAGQQFIYRFVLDAWGILGAIFSPAVLLALYDRRYTLASGWACLVAGLGTLVLWKTLGLTQYAYALFPAFLVALVAGYLVPRVTQKNR